METTEFQEQTGLSFPPSRNREHDLTAGHRFPFKWALGICVLLAAGEFALRGPARALRSHEANDFTTSYVASRLWLQGEDAYDSSKFMSTWVAAGGRRFVERGSATSTRPAYPPTALPALAVFALLPWTQAEWLLTLLTCALFVLAMRAVTRLYGFAWASSAGLALTAYSLALAPWHTAFAVVSPSVIAMELAVIGTAIRGEATGGVLEAIALCLKPQIGLYFLVFDAASKRWKRLAWAIPVIAGLLLLALLRQPSGWLHSYRENLRYFQVAGGVNDFTTANPIRFDLLNLQVISYFLFHDYRMSNVLAWLVTAVLVVIWWRRRAGLAALVLIGLLPFYQRIYNAGLVVLAIGWGLSQVRQWGGKAVLLVSSIFLVPGAALLQRLHEAGRISNSVWDHNPVLNIFLGPQATWALLLLVGILLLQSPATEFRSRFTGPGNGEFLPPR